MNLIKPLWAVPAALLLSACGVTTWFARGEPVDVTEAGRAQQCAAEDATTRVRVFESPADVQAWQQRSGVDLNRIEPLVPGRYALVEMGQRQSGGYGIAVSRDARQVGDTLRIYATFFSPAPGAMTPQVITSPCVLVRVPGTALGPVEVFDQDGERRASSQAGG